MNFNLLIALVLFMGSLCVYINERFLKLPDTIGILVQSLFMSLVLIFLGKLLPFEVIDDIFKNQVQHLDFYDVLVNLMLGVFLFAGSISVNYRKYEIERKNIFNLALFGTILNTFLLGGGFYLVVNYVFHLNISIVICLLFGAVISPSDPITTLSLLKKDKDMDIHLESIIEGESLFNDPIGVILFTILLTIAKTVEGISVEHITGFEVFIMVVMETVVTISMGLLAAVIVIKITKNISNSDFDILLSLSMIFVLSMVAGEFHMSGPLAVVVFGLGLSYLDKNYENNFDRDKVKEYFGVTEYMLNVILFLLIGVEIVIMEFKPYYVALGIIAIITMLIVRIVVVKSLTDFSKIKEKKKGFVLLVWGALRGGLGFALSLSIPQAVEARELIVAVTYIIVLFSVIIQGSTISVIVRWGKKPKGKELE